MRRFHVRIEGRTPLLCNRFTDSAAESATSGTRASTRTEQETPRELAEQGLYISEQDGKPVIPQPNVLRSLIDAGKFHKVGKTKVTTQKSSLIPACVDLDDVEYPIQHDEPWDVDTRAVRIPSTGGRILRHRAKFNDWAIEFDVYLDDSVIGAKTFRAIVDDAGSKIGLGDFRPDCKGPYGKFWVSIWKDLDKEDGT